MKKLLVFFVLTLASLGAWAQAEVGIGLKVGANLSKLDGYDNADNFTSFHAGAFALVKLSKIGIQPEILFSQQGVKSDGGDFKLTYVNIPVMLKFYLAAGVNLQVGPQFGFLTNAKHDGDDVKDFLKGSDVSASFGLGWDAPFGLMIDGRYNLGLSDISDSDDFESLKNQVIQISIGYKLFKLGN
ncbi:MAG TPA: porin family protein [Ohtaekwangia sp.]|nr:porin family protein [Ohtaekwangia sp.]